MLFPFPHKYFHGVLWLFLLASIPQMTLSYWTKITKIKTREKSTINFQTINIASILFFPLAKKEKASLYQRTIMPILLSSPRPLSITAFSPATSTFLSLMNPFHHHSNIFFFKKKKKKSLPWSHRSLQLSLYLSSIQLHSQKDSWWFPTLSATICLIKSDPERCKEQYSEHLCYPWTTLGNTALPI